MFSATRIGVIPDKNNLLSYVAQSTTATTTITIPASSKIGDIALFFDFAAANSRSPPTSVTPSGWTRIANASTEQYDACRGSVFYKVLAAGEPGSTITGMAVGVGTQKAIIVFRPTKLSGYSVTYSTAVVQGIFGDPAAQTIASNNISPPLLKYALVGSPATTVSFTQSTGFTVVSSGTDLDVAYKIENYPSANSTIDCGDYTATGVILESGYVRL